MVRWQSEYKCLLQKLDKESGSQESDKQLLRETQTFYIESLLLEVNLEQSVDLKETMKKRWPHLSTPKAPEGAEFSQNKQPISAPKQARKRPVSLKTKVQSVFDIF